MWLEILVLDFLLDQVFIVEFVIIDIVTRYLSFLEQIFLQKDIAL